MRNPYLEWANYPTGFPAMPLIPPIPPRRLLQIPDFQLDNTVTAPIDRNAATERGNLDVNFPIHHGPLPARPNQLGLTSTFSNLFGSARSLDYPWPLTIPLTAPFGLDPTSDFVGAADASGRWQSSHFLGGLTAPNVGAPPATFGYDPDFDGNSAASATYTDANTDNNVTDMRMHPAYRTELLQKVMNLTTVRTHQFAVWITVGFFEVTKAGNASTLESDTLGPELPQSNGRTLRYRSFFVIDRTRATGFNPTNPGDYNELVVYRRTIE